MPTDPIPAGAMIQLNLEAIDEGRLRHQIDEAISNAHRELREYREITERGDGEVKIAIGISLKYDPDIKDHVVVAHAVKIVAPTRTNKVLVKEIGDKLLCQPTGADGRSPDQMRLFDAKGNPLGTIDDGDFIPEGAVAGRIAQA